MLGLSLEFNYKYKALMGFGFEGYPIFVIAILRVHRFWLFNSFLRGDRVIGFVGYFGF